MIVLKFILIALIGYLIGSINSAIAMGKMHGIDIKNLAPKFRGVTEFIDEKIGR